MKLCYKRITLTVPVGLLRWLKGRMDYRRAAGGAPVDADGRGLLICRHGCWDLPKGHVEAGESLRQTALREVEEETGLACRLAAGPPLKTYHIYRLFGRWHLKQTAWFHLHTPLRSPEPAPQHEEGISRAEWVDAELWHRRLARSYGTLRQLSRQWTL